MTAVVTDTGRRIVTDTGAAIAATPGAFVDSFTRPDGPLGNGWTDGWDWNPEIYERLGIYNRAVVVADNQSRTGANYAADQLVDDPRPEQYVGIGCAWRDFDTAAAYVEVEWSGLHDFDHHVEGTPIVNVVPGTPEHGLGIWPITLFDLPFFAVGGVGNPPESFIEHLIAGMFFEHTDGVPRRIGILTTGTHCTFWLDGTQVDFQFTFNGHPTYGLDPVPVPANLVGGTAHGFELDTHVMSPPRAALEAVRLTPVVNRFVFRPA